MISLKNICIGCLLLLSACTYSQISKDAGKQKSTGDTALVEVKADTLLPLPQNTPTLAMAVVPQDIKVGAYFPFLDSMVAANDTVVNYTLTEHLLVHANPWIMDTLASFDYYERMQQGMFIYDQREMVVLHKGDTLWIPDEQTATAIEDRLHHTLIDVNIPEFKFRIIEYDTVKYIFPVRVGRNESKYLKTAGRVVNLRTPIGEGEIVRIERDPWFINPLTGERYFGTRRDDGKYTMMPLSCVVGHLECCADNTPYVVPIAYAYDGTYIYSHAREGTKIDLMRKNPQVCLEVDQIDNLSNWRSVVVWGTFEELEGEEAEIAMQWLKNRLYPLKTSFYSQGFLELTAKERSQTKEIKEVLYRIRITQTTGRFEKE